MKTKIISLLQGYDCKVCRPAIRGVGTTAVWGTVNVYGDNQGLNENCLCPIHDIHIRRFFYEDTKWAYFDCTRSPAWELPEDRVFMRVCKTAFEQFVDEVLDAEKR